MSLNIETTQGLERRVTITVPAETVVQAIREELKRVAKNARFIYTKSTSRMIAFVQTF